ncbi:hypothetical protein Tco_0056010 [Tanacetum coccineum]
MQLVLLREKGKLLLSPQQVIIGDHKDTTGTMFPNTIVDPVLEIDYPHRALKNKGIVDSGCSRHMTGNKAYLAEFQDFNGGPVAFGGSKGYITSKGPQEANHNADEKREGPREEEQVFLDDLERLKRQEKDANEAAEALRKEFAQATENLIIQARAAKASSTNVFSTVSTPAKASSTNKVTSGVVNKIGRLSHRGCMNHVESAYWNLRMVFLKICCKGCLILVWKLKEKVLLLLI